MSTSHSGARQSSVKFLRQEWQDRGLLQQHGDLLVKASQLFWENIASRRSLFSRNELFARKRRYRGDRASEGGLNKVSLFGKSSGRRVTSSCLFRRRGRVFEESMAQFGRPRHVLRALFALRAQCVRSASVFSSSEKGEEAIPGGGTSLRQGSFLPFEGCSRKQGNHRELSRGHPSLHGVVGLL